MPLPEPEARTLLGGRLRYYPEFAPSETTQHWLTTLLESPDWIRGSITLFGRRVNEPRLTCWYCDQGVAYRYSGRTLPQSAWTDQLQFIRNVVESASGQSFNSVLCNLYRDGNDYMGWHCDDESSLGRHPVIASVSLGAVRDFVVRRKDNHSDKHLIQLEHGSLLIMQGTLQQHWQHSLPRRKQVTQPRVNLTFRQVLK